MVNGTRPEEIASAKADVAEIKAQVRYYEVQLEDTKIRAPFAGIITQRYALQGAFVTPTTSASATDTGSSTSIVALAQDLEVLAKVTESDIGQIKPGQTVEIVADAYPDKVFSGRVKLIAPEAVKDRDVTLFEVRVAIDKGKDLLQSGMNVDLKFLGEKLNNALVLPTVAIVTSKGQTGVLIPDEKNQPKFQLVTIGSTIGNKIQILEGLKAGDRVFLELPEGKNLDDIIKNRK
jgi:HlyD family secretion protein